MLMKNELETGRTPIKPKQQETCNRVGWGQKASFQVLHPWEGSDTRRRTFPLKSEQGEPQSGHSSPESYAPETNPLIC